VLFLVPSLWLAVDETRGLPFAALFLTPSFCLATFWMKEERSDYVKNEQEQANERKVKWHSDHTIPESETSEWALQNHLRRCAIGNIKVNYQITRRFKSSPFFCSNACFGSGRRIIILVSIMQRAILLSE
jgi:hypothetical protein